MKAAPTASLVVAQAEFLLQFLVILFDDPAVFGQVHQFPEIEIRRQRGQPVLGWFRFRGWPFDQPPFFRMRRQVWQQSLATPALRAACDTTPTSPPPGSPPQAAPGASSNKTVEGPEAERAQALIAPHAVGLRRRRVRRTADARQVHALLERPSKRVRKLIVCSIRTAFFCQTS